MSLISKHMESQDKVVSYSEIQINCQYGVMFVLITYISIQ